MPSFKVAILEKDGVEYDLATEYDLYTALIQLGFSTSGIGGTFDENKLLSDDSFELLMDDEGNVLTEE